jgi:hypothetical protein
LGPLPILGPRSLDFWPGREELRTLSKLKKALPELKGESHLNLKRSGKVPYFACGVLGVKRESQAVGPLVKELNFAKTRKLQSEFRDGQEGHKI